MAVDMYGSMTGWSAWMMTRTWDFTHQLLLFAMWELMMIGMMLPSATPALFLYGAVIRKSPQGDRAPAHVYAFAAGYLVVWTVFSLVATVLQLLLARGVMLSRMMEARNRWLAGALLLLAGIYQLTPFKRTCLQSCRSPLAFITQHWKRGVMGGFRMGLAQGWYCLGCCWALMLLLFVGGVMNLWWIAALTIFVLLEKLAPLGVQGGRLSGVILLAMGLWTVIRG
jgi:predicted metal-binding membrane protein